MKRPLTTYTYRKARAAILAGATHCALCGQPLDHNAKAHTYWSTTVDHIIPISQGGNPYDLSNMRPAHKGCNTSRGNGRTTGKGTRRPRTQPIRGTRSW